MVKLIMILLFAIGLTGCADEVLIEEDFDSIVKESLSISVAEGASTPAFLEFIEAFKSRHEVEITINERPSGRAGETIVTTELLTGNMSDILLFSSGALFFMQDPEMYFLDISDESFTSEYQDAYRLSVSIDDKIFGLPLSTATAIGFFYNKAIYAELGLEVPTDWDEFQRNLKEVKGSQKNPVLAPFKDQWVTQYYWMAAGFQVQEETESQSINGLTDQNLQGYESILRKFLFLHDEGYFNEDYLTLTLTNGFSEFAESKSVHFLGTFGFSDYLSQEYHLTSSEVGFFPFPGESEEQIGFTFSLPNSLYISNMTENEQLARTFFREYYEYILSNLEESELLPSVFKTSQYSLSPLIKEHTQMVKVNTLPEMLIDLISGTLSIEAFLERYEENFNRELLITPIQ